MKPPLTVYWSRRDFRLLDNQALFHAAAESSEKNTSFLPLFILEPYMERDGSTYSHASRTLLSRILPHFATHFPNFLTLRGTTSDVFRTLSQHYTLSIHVNEDVHPDFFKQVQRIQEHNISIHIHPDRLTIPKDTKTKTGLHYSIFTPFKNAVWGIFIDTQPYPRPDLSHVTPTDIHALHTFPNRIETNETALTNIFPHDRIFRVDKYTIDLSTLTTEPDFSSWYTNETQAWNHWNAYLTQSLDTYETNRNDLSQTTSMMSLGLSWGLLSSRALIHSLKEYTNDTLSNPKSNRHTGAYTFISELIWREFYAYLFFHNPHLEHEAFQEKFRHIAWETDTVAYQRFIAWIRGETGYPIVDAAMQQIAQTGWMHNRARMIVSSILTKHLGVDWRWGMEYFRATLVDLDESSNIGGWQWGASVGADPKPIRIFNPYLQAQRYDPDNAYTSHWLPPAYNTQPLIPHDRARRDALTRYKLGTTSSETTE